MTSAQPEQKDEAQQKETVLPPAAVLRVAAEDTQRATPSPASLSSMEGTDSIPTDTSSDPESSVPAPVPCRTQTQPSIPVPVIEAQPEHPMSVDKPAGAQTEQPMSVDKPAGAQPEQPMTVDGPAGAKGGVVTDASSIRDQTAADTSTDAPEGQTASDQGQAAATTEKLDGPEAVTASDKHETESGGDTETDCRRITRSATQTQQQVRSNVSQSAEAVGTSDVTAADTAKQQPPPSETAPPSPPPAPPVVERKFDLKEVVKKTQRAADASELIRWDGANVDCPRDFRALYDKFDNDEYFSVVSASHLV